MLQQPGLLFLGCGKSYEGSAKPSTKSKSPWSSFITWELQNKRSISAMEKEMATVRSYRLLGSLSNDDGNGKANVSNEKVTSRYFYNFAIIPIRPTYTI